MNHDAAAAIDAKQSTPEMWKPIPGFPKHEASDQGRIRSWHRATTEPRYLTGAPGGSGDRYRRIVLGGTPTYLHRIIALTFIGPPPAEGYLVRHLDDDPANNAVANLAYGTKVDNSRDAIRNGRNPKSNQTACAQGHTYTPETTLVRENGLGRTKRVCLICNRKWQAKYEAKRRVA